MSWLGFLHSESSGRKKWLVCYKNLCNGTAVEKKPAKSQKQIQNPLGRVIPKKDSSDWEKGQPGRELAARNPQKWRHHPTTPDKHPPTKALNAKWNDTQTERCMQSSNKHARFQCCTGRRRRVRRRASLREPLTSGCQPEQRAGVVLSTC